MIYYSLSVLMLAGIREFLIITSGRDIDRFQSLFKDGRQLGIDIKFALQNNPNGIAEALLIGENFINNEPVVLILGDNILFGVELGTRLRAIKSEDNAIIFSHEVKEPERYGVVEIDANGDILSLQEKPQNARSRLAVPGLYMYPSDVVDHAKSLSPSDRGELEITDLNNLYLKEGRLEVMQLGRGYAWLDAGTESSLLEASNFVSAIENRQGQRIGCIEEIAWQMDFISLEQLGELGNSMKSSDYGKYILSLVES